MAAPSAPLPGLRPGLLVRATGAIGATRPGAKLPGSISPGWTGQRALSLVRSFAADKNEKSATYYRIFNEIPTLAMIVIVVMVVVKPF